jgi:hypothetical protein
MYLGKYAKFTEFGRPVGNPQHVMSRRVSARVVPRKL